MASDRLAIIGGGVMGLGIGWQMAKAGQNVTVLDSEAAGQGASWAAAGMIAPVSEVKFQEEKLLKLNLVSHGLYPKFVDELESETSMKLGYRKEGTIIVALDRDDAEWLRNLFDFKKELGLNVEWISGQTARELEPSISPKVHSAMFNTTDHQIDNRLLVLALKQAFLQQNGTLKEHSTVTRIEIENGTVKGVIVDGEMLEAGQVILAAGSWSKRIEGLPDELIPPVRPVKGQMCSVDGRRTPDQTRGPVPGGLLDPERRRTDADRGDRRRKRIRPDVDCRGHHGPSRRGLRGGPERIRTAYQRNVGGSPAGNPGQCADSWDDPRGRSLYEHRSLPARDSSTSRNRSGNGPSVKNRQDPRKHCPLYHRPIYQKTSLR